MRNTIYYTISSALTRIKPEYERKTFILQYYEVKHWQEETLVKQIYDKKVISRKNELPCSS